MCAHTCMVSSSCRVDHQRHCIRYSSTYAPYACCLHRNAAPVSPAVHGPGFFTAHALLPPACALQFIHLTYTPPGEVKRTVAVVGKGLTFDSGGYNLKAGAGSMIEMMKVGGRWQGQGSQMGQEWGRGGAQRVVDCVLEKNRQRTL